MTRERCQELLPAMRAFAEGKTIESRDGCNKWELITHGANWLDGIEYRVKPEPREFWIVRSSCGHRIYDHDPVLAGVIHVREILD